MITKTRLQFIIALFLIVLPFLGMPAWLDTILVSLGGVTIAVTTFLTARERRLKVRSANMVDKPKEVDVEVNFDKPVKVAPAVKKSSIKNDTKKSEPVPTVAGGRKTLHPEIPDMEYKGELSDESDAPVVTQIPKPVPNPVPATPAPEATLTSAGDSSITDLPKGEEDGSSKDAVADVVTAVKDESEETPPIQKPEVANPTPSKAKSKESKKTIMKEDSPMPTVKKVARKRIKTPALAGDSSSSD